MSQYAIIFDLDTDLMKDNGLSSSEIKNLYDNEITEALASCGFTEHPYISLYYTRNNKNPVLSVLKVKVILNDNAPNFCRYVKQVHMFRMEEWSDVTSLFSSNSSKIPNLDA